MIWKWVFAIFFWIIAIAFIMWGIRLTEETHRKKSFTDYAPSLGLSNSFIGFAFELIFSLIIGLIMKVMPWWMAKGVLVIVGVGFMLFGYLCIKG